MTAEERIYAALSGAAAVTAVVSDRIYPDSIPQDVTLPAIAYTRAGTEYATTIHRTVEATRAIVEVWTHATKREAAESLASLVMTALIPEDFFPTDRRAEYDHEGKTYSSVLVYSIWEL